MAGGMGGGELLPRRGCAGGRQAEILCVGDVSVSEREDPHGACAQLRARRRGGAVQAGAWLRRDAPDGVGRVRAAGGERGAGPGHPSGRVDAGEHRDHARRAAAHGAVDRLVTRVRNLRRHVLRASAGIVPGVAVCRVGGSAAQLRQLGSGGRHRAGQRAGDRRQGLAVGRCRREARAGAVVLPDHAVRAGVARGAGRAGPLAGAGAHDAGALDRAERGRAGALPAGRWR